MLLSDSNPLARLYVFLCDLVLLYVVLPVRVIAAQLHEKHQGQRRLLDQGVRCHMMLTVIPPVYYYCTTVALLLHYCCTDTELAHLSPCSNRSGWRYYAHITGASDGACKYERKGCHKGVKGTCKAKVKIHWG